jgi:hypothetical protein
MKSAVISVLKVLIPLALGIWLIYYFYDQLNEHQREELFTAFKQANLWWFLLAALLSWFSHLSRAWRWRYLIEHMGYKVGFWNAYNATMSGYFMNLLIPRAGEASRAVMLYRAEGVPFEKGFGTILAERTVDLIMVLTIAGITLALQWDKLALFQEKIAAFRAEQSITEDAGPNYWWLAILGVVVIGGIATIYLMYARPELRARLKDGMRGFISGLRSVLETKHRWAFILHTILIWSLYVAMFWVGFFALSSTTSVPAAGVFASFIAGTIGIILVQGGVGVYPAFVGLIVSIYMPMPEGGGLIRPDALAMGWLLWLSQTLLVIVLGGISLFLISPKGNGEGVKRLKVN